MKSSEHRSLISGGRDREFADSPLEESGFEPLVPLQTRHNRGTGPMHPSCILIPLAIESASLLQVGPAVRIRFPPAESQVRTSITALRHADVRSAPGAK